jgi:hypothetical protein
MLCNTCPLPVDRRIARRSHDFTQPLPPLAEVDPGLSDPLLKTMSGPILTGTPASAIASRYSR